MSKPKLVQCHDCEAEVKVSDMYGDLDASDIKHCPLCGSDNIEVYE